MTIVKRKEMKYLIENKEYILLKNRLNKILKRDEHDKGEGYIIKSLYFDTLDNKHYYEKQAGDERREKIRLRIYPPNKEPIKLEIKNKSNNISWKETVTLSRKEASDLQKGEYEWMLKKGETNPILKKAYFLFKENVFKPVLITEYLREAYVHDVGNIRITFDKALSANATNLNLSVLSDTNKNIDTNNLVVMEVKYNHIMPEFIKQAIQIKNFAHVSVSKYCLGRITYG